MNIRFLRTACTGFIAIVILNWSCTKIDTTTLGDDLIPVVDNVSTFGDTLNILAYQGIFNPDTTLISLTEDRILGKIDNDPDFGQTDAKVYAQFKPAFYPYFIEPRGDTLVGLDSVVLTLAVRGLWGDTTPSRLLQTIQVREIPAHTGGLWDTLYKSKRLNYAPVADGTGEILGSTTVDIRTLKDTVKFNKGRSSAVNQIRIKLSAAFLQKILDTDSAAVTRAGYLQNAFYKDSIFREYYEGFTIESVGTGNTLMRISLTDDNSRLELHYRKRRNNVLDTTFTTFDFVDNLFNTVPSAAANKITRTYNGTLAPVPPAGPQNEIYIQTTPGTYADLKIPELVPFRDTNRIIHRAQLRIKQVPGSTDDKFTPPNFLYLDLRDSMPALRHKPVYIDLNPGIPYSPDNVPKGFYFPNEVNYGYFGGYLRKMLDPISGRMIAYYDFNITRYIQRMVTQHSYVYDMRLFAPYSFSYPQYDAQMIPYGNNLAQGRVKVGGTDGNYKMQLSIIWSKVKVP